MEELSSGLEVQATAIVVLIVHNTTSSYWVLTVVCTIHQSSIDIFETFDEVQCLIKKKN
jgi:hypothetical protein